MIITCNNLDLHVGKYENFDLIWIYFFSIRKTYNITKEVYLYLLDSVQFSSVQLYWSFKKEICFVHIIIQYTCIKNTDKQTLHMYT